MTERFEAWPLACWWEVVRIHPAGYSQFIAAFADEKDARDLATFLGERMQAAA